MKALNNYFYDLNTCKSLFVAVIIQAIIDYYSINREIIMENVSLRNYRIRKSQQIKHSLEARHWFKTLDCKFICGLANVNYDCLIRFLENNETLENEFWKKN